MLLIWFRQPSISILFVYWLIPCCLIICNLISIYLFLFNLFFIIFFNESSWISNSSSIWSFASFDFQNFSWIFCKILLHFKKVKNITLWKLKKFICFIVFQKFLIECFNHPSYVIFILIIFCGLILSIVKFIYANLFFFFFILSYIFIKPWM